MQDSSGHGHNARPVNSPDFTGEAIDLTPGRNQYVELPEAVMSALQASPSYSFVGWAVFDTVGSTDQTMELA